MRKSLTLALLMTSLFAKAQYHVVDAFGEPASTSHSYYTNMGQIIDDTGGVRTDILFYTEQTSPSIFVANDRVSYVMRSRGNDTVADSSYRIDAQFKCPSWSDNIPCGQIHPYEPSEDYLNYYLPHCSSGITDVPGYAGIVYENAFQNIDVHLYSNSEGLKQYIQFKPGANPNDFVLKFTGQDSIVVLDSLLVVFANNHQMVIPLAFAYELDNQDSVVQLGWKPEWIDLHNGEVGIGIGPWTGNQKLVIEIGNPQKTAGVALGDLDWSTYYGDDGFQRVPVIASNSANILYHAMGIYLGTFPLENGSHASNQSANAGEHDCYISRFNANGGRQWSTYYGGTLDDLPKAVHETSPASSTAGQIFVAGSTLSTNLPLGGSATFKKTAHGGNTDGFITSFGKTDGHLIFGTYFGGNGEDEVTSLSSDNNSQLYFGGKTTSTVTNSSNNCVTPTSANEFPLCSGSGSRYFQSTNGGSSDGFLGSINTSTNALTWSTFFGGSGAEGINTVTWSPADNTVYIGGNTASLSPSGTSFPSGIQHPSSTGVFPLANPGSSAYFQYVNASNGFIGQFNTARALAWCTFFGGNSWDLITKVATNSTGDLYIAGRTNSSTGSTTNSQSANNTGLFPLYHDVNSYHQTYGGGLADAFVGRFSTSHQLKWSTYFGGNGDECYYSTISGEICDIVVAPNDEVFVSGYSLIYNGNSADNIPVKAAGGRYNQPTNASTGIPTPGHQYDGWIAQFYSNNKEKWITNFGGELKGTFGPLSPHDEIDAIAIGGTASDVTLYATGVTQCDNTPTMNAPSPAYYKGVNLGYIDAFISRFRTVNSLSVYDNVLVSKGAELFVTPNPSNGQFEVNYKSTQTTDRQVPIKVINSVGQVIINDLVASSSGISKFTVDLKAFPSGLYILSIGGINSASARLIKK